MHRTTVYRLLKHVQAEGEHAFIERRHGHPTKLRGEVLTWMLDHCQSHPSTSSADVQRRLSKRFGLSVSVSQLNRVCAAYSVRRVPPPREKKVGRQTSSEDGSLEDNYKEKDAPAHCCCPA